MVDAAVTFRSKEPEWMQQTRQMMKGNGIEYGA